MNSLYSSNQKKKKTESIKFVENNMVEAGFGPATATPNLTLRTTGTYFPKGTLKLFNNLLYSCVLVLSIRLFSIGYISF